MSSWSEFNIDAPELSAFGRARLQYRTAYLATIRADGSPRVHPVSPMLAGDGLFIYMEPTSPKGHDLGRDARYAMHCAVEDNSGGQGEFLVRGTARVVFDASVREQTFEHARRIGFEPQERYVLFELSVEEAMSTVYEDGEPKLTRWVQKKST